MQILILDRHATSDARLDRHIKTASKAANSVSRIRMGKPGESFPKRVRKRVDGDIVSLRPLGSSNPLLHHILQMSSYLLPGCLYRHYRLQESLPKQDERTVIHVHDPELLGLARYLSRRYFYDSSIVYDRHEVFEEAGGAYGMVSLLFERINRDSVDGVVTISPAYTESVSQRFAEARISYVPNFPLQSEYDQDLVSAKIESLDEDTEILLTYIGSLNNDYDRDIDLLLDLMEAALSQNQKVVCSVGGRLNSRTLGERMENLSIEFPGRFRYLGYVDRNTTLELTEKSHIGFFLLRPESNYWVKSSPNKFFEYLVTGNIAVVRADIDAEIPTGSAMLFSRVEPPELIISTVLELLDDIDRMKSMMASAQRLGNQFLYEQVEDNYLRLYAELE